MADSAEARRRWFGLFFLALAAGMLIWGQTVLKPYLTGFLFLLYWALCFVLTGLAIITALLDMRATRRRIRREQRELIERTWRDIHDKPDDWDKIK
ncbi:MAG: hypothetical protein HZA90_03320 [Verrucomicrobia bacterium]|nr:hypothetical protein [Verrucomicrobiota bacterium]